MIEQKYYISCDENGRTGLGSRQWPLPKDKELGEWLNVGEDSSSYLVLNTLKGLLYGRKLNMFLYKADYKGHQIIPSYFQKAKEDPRYVETGSICVRESRLISKVDSWKSSIAMTFACTCAERAFDTAIGKPSEACYQALDLGHRFMYAYQQMETGIGDREIKDLMWEIIMFEHETGNKIFPSHDEVTDLGRELDIEINKGKVGPYAGKAARALCTLRPYSAANDAAKNACHGRSRIAWTEHGGWQLTKVSNNQKELAESSMKDEWIKELDWQVAYLASLLGEGE